MLGVWSRGCCGAGISTCTGTVECTQTWTLSLWSPLTSCFKASRCVSSYPPTWPSLVLLTFFYINPNSNNLYCISSTLESVLMQTPVFYKLVFSAKGTAVYAPTWCSPVLYIENNQQTVSFRVILSCIHPSFTASQRGVYVSQHHPHSYLLYLDETPAIICQWWHTAIYWRNSLKTVWAAFSALPVKSKDIKRELKTEPGIYVHVLTS